MSDFKIDSKKIAKNTFALYFRMAFTMVVSFFTTRVTLEVLGSEDYGLNNLVGSLVSLFSFLNGAMGTAVQRFYCVAIGKKDDDSLKKIFGCSLYIHLIIAIITLIIGEVFAIFLFDKLVIPDNRLFAAHVVFQLSILSMFLSIVNVPYAAMLRAREEFTVIAYADIITAIFRLAILYALYVIDYDKLVVFACLNFIISIGNVFYLFIRSRRYKEVHSGIKRDAVIIKEMVSFVSLLFFTILAQLLRDNGLSVLVNLFFGLALNAAFAVAVQVTHMLSTFVMNFKQSIVPQLMAAWAAKDLTSVNRLISLGTKVTFLLMLLISLPIIFESDFLLTVWLNNPPQYSANLVSLATISINISSFTYFLYQAVHATGRIRQQQLYLIVIFVLNIAFIYLAYKLGASFYYAYYITIIMSLMQCLINVYSAKKHINLSLRYFLSKIILPSFLLLFFCTLSYYMTVKSMESGWARCLVGCMVELIIGLLGGYILLLTSDEKKMINRVFSRV